MTVREIWDECKRTVLFLLITAFLACFPLIIDAMPRWFSGVLVLTIVALLFSLTFLTFGKKIAGFSTGSQKAEFLFLTYIELIVFFAAVYFLFALIGDGSYHFNGRDLSIYGADPSYHPIDASAVFFKFLYFSVVTATTLGYGDISPASWQTQAVTIGQVLFSLYIVVVGFGAFFSGASVNKDGG